MSIYHTQNNTVDSEHLLSVSRGPIPYGLTNDYMFRAVLQKSEDALKHLLAALLDISFESITSCQILNPIILGEAIDEKSCIMDIRLEVNHKQMINLEMQAGHFDYWAARLLFYLSKLYCNIKRGENYSDIKPALHIGILTDSPFEEVQEFYSEYYMMNPVNKHILSRNFSARMLDLSQIENVVEEQRDTELYYWARLFTATTWEEINMLSREKDYLNSAASYLRILTEDEKIQQQCEARERYHMDIDSSRIGGYNHGIKVGTEQGILSGIIKSYKELGASREAAALKIQQELNWNVETAERYVREHW